MAGKDAAYKEQSKNRREIKQFKKNGARPTYEYTSYPSASQKKKYLY